MAYDIEMIKKVYAELPSKIAAARKVFNRPLTLTEKILYSHLHMLRKSWKTLSAEALM
jgi:aconitate hydratase